MTIGHQRTVRICFGLTLMAAPRLAGAQQIVGEPATVNTATAVPATTSDVAIDDAGNFVVVWTGYDADREGVFGRRYDANGQPLGAVFAVNTYTTVNQANPRVASLATGEFLIVWLEHEAGSTTNRILGRRYDASGAPAAPEFQINAPTARASGPDVAADPRGGFVVVWSDHAYAYHSVFARRYDAAGAPASAAFRVNAGNTSSLHNGPSVAVDASGSFVVTWNLSSYSGEFRRFDGADTPQTGDVPIAATVMRRSNVALEPDGTFMIVWDADQAVRGRTFDATGAPLGPSFLVAEDMDVYYGGTPDVVADPTGSGQFVVAWQAADLADEFSVNFRTEGVTLDREGDPVGPGFQVSGVQFVPEYGPPSVAMNAHGRIVTSWSDAGTRNVFARRLLADLIFADDFDSGDASAWSGVSTENGDVRASTDAALHGSHGLEIVVNDTQALRVRDETPVDEARYRARFQFDPNGFDPGEALNHRRIVVFMVLDRSPVKRVVEVILRRLGGIYSVRGRVLLDDGTRAETPFVTISDSPHVIELDWVKATAPGANDGSFELWVDGVAAPALTGLDNDANGVDLVRLGALVVKPGASGSLYFDHFESRRETYIGP